MGRKRKAKPLFYIEQPNLKEYDASMQKTYHVKIQDSKDIEDNTETPTEENVEDIKDDNIEAPAAENVVSENMEFELQQSEGETKRKPFHALSVPEKIAYLEEFPVSVIKILYLFITEDGRTIGYFVSKGEETINILPKNKRKPIEIGIGEIIDIKVYGL